MAGAVIYDSLLALAAVAWKRSRIPQNLASNSTSVFAILAFSGLLYFGLAMNIQVARSGNIRSQVEVLKSRLPENARLVSLGGVYHLFRYHFHQPIEQLPVSSAADLENMDFECFCFNTYPRDFEINFPWLPIAAIPSSDRNRNGRYETVTIGQRLPRQTAGKTQPTVRK